MTAPPYTRMGFIARFWDTQGMPTLCTVYGGVCGGVSGLTSVGVGCVVKDLTSMHDMQQSSARVQPWSVTCGGESGLLCYAGGAV